MTRAQQSQTIRTKTQNIKQLQIIDVAEDLLQETNLDSLYSDKNEYGGHYSIDGNQKIASIINHKLTKND